MIFRAYLTAALALALVGCGPVQSPEQQARAAELGPNGVFVTGPAQGDGFLYAELDSFTDGGTVTRLGVIFKRSRGTPDGSIVTIGQADFAVLWASIDVGQLTDVAAAERAGRQVAQATFCSTGPITLNQGRTSSGQGGSRQSVPPVAFQPQGGASVDVLLRCNSTNPYYSPERLQESRDPGPNASELRAQVLGRTSLSYSVQHGTQLEYLAPNGQTFLWYPGNQRVVSGQWRVEMAPSPARYSRICFAYGGNTVNPVTGNTSGRNCQPAVQYLRLQRDTRSGDVFGLSSGQVPFVLDDAEHSFASLGRN